MTWGQDDPVATATWGRDDPVLGGDADEESRRAEQEAKTVDRLAAIAAGTGLPVSQVEQTYDEAGAIGFWESTKEEFLRGAKGAQLIPFLGGAVEAAEQLQLLDAMNRIRTGFDYTKPIRPGELRAGAMGYRPAVYRTREQDERLLGDYIVKQVARSQRAYAWHGVAAKGLIQMPTWMLEFWLTGGLAKIGNAAVQEAGEKILKQYARSKLGQAGLKTAGWAGGAITRASLGLTPRAGAKGLERQVRVQVLGVGEEGWATSFVKGWGDMVIEAASEEAGETITGIPAKLLQKTRFGRRLVSGLQKGWMKATGGTPGAFTRKMAGKGGYSNILGEIGEERLGTILRAVTGVSDGPSVQARLEEGLMDDARNFGAELLVLSAPTAAQMAGGQVVSRMHSADTENLGKMMDSLRKVDPDRAGVVEQELRDRGALPKEEAEVRKQALEAAKAERAVRKPAAEAEGAAPAAEEAAPPAPAEGAELPAPKQIGDGVQVAGIDAIVAKTERIDDVDYELYNANRLKDKRGVLRIADPATGEVVSIKTYPTYDQAEAEYEKAVRLAKAQPPAPAEGRQPWEMTQQEWLEGDTIEVDATTGTETLTGPKFDTEEEAWAYAKAKGWTGDVTISQWGQQYVPSTVPPGMDIREQRRVGVRGLHKRAVEQAQRRGEYIRPEVLAEYPDLKAKADAALAKAQPLTPAPPAAEKGEKPPAPPEPPPVAEAEQPAPEDATEKLRQRLKDIRKVRPQVTAAQKQARGAKARSFEELLEYMTTPVEQGGLGLPYKEALPRAKAAWKGPLTEYQLFEPLGLDPGTSEDLYRDIGMTDRLRTYERGQAEEAFRLVEEGNVIPPHQIRILKKWKPELADEWDKFEKRQPWTMRAASKLEQALSLLKLSAAFDVQMRRQARWLRARHPKLFTEVVGKNIQAYISEKHAQKQAEEVVASPNHEMARKAGAVFLELDETRPEQFINKWAERFPILGKIYKASLRGFVNSFNWLQQQLWDYKIAQWNREGREITPQDLADLAEYNNTFLGVYPARSQFGRSLRRVLAPVMWSPTLTWSRVRSPEMILTNKAMRGETALTLGSYIGSGLFMLAAGYYLALLLGKNPDEVVNLNLTSSDLGKLKVGNTRVDVFGDGGPLIRALIQFVTQKKTNQAGRTRGGWFSPRRTGIEPLKQFFRNKRAPFIDLMSQIWTKRNYYGGRAYALPDWAEIKEEGGVKKLMAKAGEKLTEPKAGEIAYFFGRDVLRPIFVPFFLQGTLEAAWNDGAFVSLWAGAEEMMSGSVLSYEPSDYAKAQMLQDQAAVGMYDKLWEDLSPRQQERIRNEIPEIGEFEEKASFERAPAEEISLSEQNKSAQKVLRAMPQAVRKELTVAKVRITGLSRKWGDFWLNDKRYQAYQDAVTEELELALSSEVATRGWSTLDPVTKAEILRKDISRAKEIARLKLRDQIERGDL